MNQNPLHHEHFETPSIWTEVAEAYAESVMPLFGLFAGDGIGWLAPAEDARVLDLAAGPGTATMILAQKVAEVTAIDFSSRMIEELRLRAGAQGLNNLKSAVMDGHSLDFAPESFDVVTSCFGVVHFADPDRGLREVRRVLKPGGRVMIASWAPPSESDLMGALFEALRATFPGITSGDAVFHHRIDSRKLPEWLEARGFRDVEARAFTHAFEIPSAAQFWSSMCRSSVPVVLLRKGCDAKAWQQASASIVDYLERRHRWPLGTAAKAYIALGTKGAG